MNAPTEETGQEDDIEEVPGGTGAKLWRLAVRSAVVAAVVLLAVMVFKLWPAELPIKDNAGFIDIIFGSRFVVFAVRALIIFASLYAALSVVVLIWNDRWITGFAGVQTAKIERSVSGLAEERDRLADALGQSEETIEGLEEELQDALAQLEQTSASLDKALADRHIPGNGVITRLKCRWQQRGGRM